MSDDKTCPYCGYRFDTKEARERHIPCPEARGDKRKKDTT